MQYVKVRVLKNGVPSGGEYTYSADDSIKVGDIVNLPHFRPSESTNYPKGIVVGVEVTASMVAVPLENVRRIIGLAEVEKTPLKRIKDLRDIQAQDGNWDANDHMLGMYNGLEIALAILENREPDFRSLEKE